MPHVEFMEKLDRADKLLRQFPHGIRAVDFAQEFGVKRQNAYDFLNSLEVRGFAYSEHGLWFPKENEIHDTEDPSQRKLDDLVEEAFTTLEKENDRFTLQQVASKVGLPPSDIEASVYRLVKKHGWETEKSDTGDIEIGPKHEVFVAIIPNR